MDRDVHPVDRSEMNDQLGSQEIGLAADGGCKELGSFFHRFCSETRQSYGRTGKENTTLKGKRVYGLDDGHNSQLRSAMLAHGVRVLGCSPYVFTETGSDSRTSKQKDSS